jgi:hypothetical protein
MNFEKIDEKLNATKQEICEMQEALTKVVEDPKQK